MLVLVLGILTAGFGYWFQVVKLKEFSKEVFLMDTLIQITVYHGDRTQGQEALRLAVDQFARISVLTDRFPQKGKNTNPASEVFRINENAGIAPVTVSAELLDIVEQSLRYSALSEGAFDLTVGPLMDLWGFGQETQRAPSDAEIAAVLPLVDYRLVQVDPAQMTIYLPKTGMGLDLGGVAKGYATEKAAEQLKKQGIKHALINAGGNIYALGSKPGGRPWRVGVRDPRDGAGMLGVLAVEDLALVTSGDNERFFEENGVRYSHLLDPATGKQAGEMIQTTVAAVSSTDADIINKPLFVLGWQDGPAFAATLPIAGVLLVNEKKEVFATGVFAANLEFAENSGYRLIRE